jgi:hypothetical protein
MSIPIFDINEMSKYDLESKEHTDYIKYLTVFNKQEDGKLDQYIKETDKNVCILIDKKEPSKKIKIYKSKFLDLNHYFKELNDEISDILYKIIYLLDNNIIDDNKRDQFTKLKESYLKYNEAIKGINIINTINKGLIDNLINDIKDKYLLLIKYFNDRKEIYNKIDNKITNEIRINIINIFKEKGNKIPDDSIIVGFSKKFNVSVKDLDNWFKWVEASYLYIKIQKELLELNKRVEEELESQDFKKRFFIYQKPHVEIIKSTEVKKIKVKKV